MRLALQILGVTEETVPHHQFQALVLLMPVVAAAESKMELLPELVELEVVVTAVETL